MDDIDTLFAQQVRRPGHCHSDEMYAFWIERYHTFINDHGVAPSIYEFSKIQKISYGVAKKIVLFCKGETDSIHKSRVYKTGYGSRTLNEADENFLLYIYDQDNSTPLSEYSDLLYMFSGKRVSESTLCKWFKYSMFYKSSVRKTSVFSHNKYNYSNLIRLNNYINYVQTINHYRLIFTDEKPYKSMSIFNDTRRRDTHTGQMPHVCANINNLKNCFNIMAAVKINGIENENIFYQIGKFSGNSITFRQFVLNMIESNFIQEGDILVCDNASIHTRGECMYLREDLYQLFGISILLLPTYHPELNPIELIFNILVQRVKHSGARYEDYLNNENSKVMHVCANALNSITNNDIKKVYRKCGYIV